MAGDMIDIRFEGFFLCRLATDPDPSLEERGISGFTYAVAGESLLDPSIFTQAGDVLREYGPPDPAYQSTGGIKNIREASPDYERYNRDGIGLRVTGIDVQGSANETLTERLGGASVRFTSEGVPNHRFLGPIFEGRNQIVSDGDPDRFTLNPFVIQISDQAGSTVLQRFDPLDPSEPERQLFEIDDATMYEQRLPCQRFPTSDILLAELGIADPEQHFVNRSLWLQEKVIEAEAQGKPALAEAYRSRQFAVDFFTQATGPTVLENRLASRIPLRQLYAHPIRGRADAAPPLVVDDAAFDPGDPRGRVHIDTERDWDILYYIGAYDGDLMSGFIQGCLSVPFTFIN
jgi:hypothetical protein